MATVLRADGFSVRIFTRDHDPAHVHVWKAGVWIKVLLPTEDQPAAVLKVFGMKPKDIARAVSIVEDNASTLWAAWRVYHEDQTTE